MDFSGKFWRAFTWHPRKALIALYWYLTRRRVRALNTLDAIARTAPYLYDAWIEDIEDIPGTLLQSAETIAVWDTHPQLMIFTSDGITPELAADLERQCYSNWILHTFPAGGISALVEIFPRGHALLVSNGVRLPPTTLFHFADAIRRFPDAAAYYGDTDLFSDSGKRIKPWLKPDWNREMFLAQDYLSDSCVLNLAILREALKLSSQQAAASWSAAVTATAIRQEARVCHVPKITAHLPQTHQQATPDPARFAVLSTVLQSDGAAVTAGPFGTTRVTWPLPDTVKQPLVSIIIPTRDRLDLLQPCVESLRSKTRYGEFEILIVDNGSVDPATLAYLARIETEGPVRILHDPSPYNFAQLNNRAVAYANGPLVCFLNNDTEIVSADWLGAMVRQAIRPQVGAVGAKLLYPDKTIQHAGIVIGMGQAAGHAHRFSHDNRPGYFLQPHIARYVSAVTAACLVVDRDKFNHVGGFDQINFAIAYNDVDLCLKLQRAGWHNLYTPDAVVIHHESVSRGDDLSAQNSPRYLRELQALQERWSTREVIDPYHHPDLDRSSENFNVRL